METLTPPEQPYLFPEPAEEYKILVPDAQHSQQQSPEALQEAYLERLSQLIDSAVGDPENVADTLVFLDKSARPLAWMMRSFWPYLAPERKNPETGEVEVVPMPAMKFANIDRLPWREDPQVEIADGGKMREPTEADIRGLRNIYQIGSTNELDGKNVMIIDEQSDSGDTLHVAEVLFSRAFPTAKLRTAAWITHAFTYDSKSGKKKYMHKEVPVWYPVKDDDNLPDDETGRAVYGAAPYNQHDKAHPDRFEKESYPFLSTRPNVRRIDSRMTTTDKERVATLEQALMKTVDPQAKENLRTRIHEIKNRPAAIIRFRQRLSETDDPEEQKRLKDHIHELEYISVDARGMQLRQEVGRLVLDFLNGTLNPAIYSEREHIRGIPADEYLRASSEKRSARKKTSLINR